jgi:hypothetical protein
MSKDKQKWVTHVEKMNGERCKKVDRMKERLQNVQNDLIGRLNFGGIVYMKKLLICPFHNVF